MIRAITQAELNAYAHPANGAGPTDAERRKYLLIRYSEIVAQHKGLVFQREEAEAVGDSEALGKLAHMFVGNLIRRTWFVGRLRSLGQTINDPYVSKKTLAEVPHADDPGIGTTTAAKP